MKTSGKKISFVDNNFFIEDIQETGGTATSDFIRFSSKNIWTRDKNNIVLARNIKNKYYFTVTQLNSNTLLLSANKNEFLSDVINERGLLERKFNKDAWESYIEENFPEIYEKNHEDYYFQVPELTELKNTSRNNSSLGINYCKKKFVYNFYTLKYEQLISDQTTDITAFPAFLNTINDPNAESRTFEENLILSLGGVLPPSEADILYLSNKTNDRLLSYYNMYSDAFLNPNSRVSINFASEFNSNLLVTKDKISYLKGVNFVPFPMYVDIQFTNFVNSDNDFFNAIEEFGGVKKDLEIFLIEENAATGQEYFRNFSQNNVSTETRIKYYDIKNWINKGIAGDIGVIATNNPGEAPRNLRSLLPVEYSNLINYMKKNIKTKLRDYRDMFSKPCYSEILYYKVEKRQYNFDRAPIIQTFYIEPNKDSLIRLIDSQIKYGTEYYYTIKAYTMVVGNKYSYEPYDYSKDQILYKNDIKEGNFRVNIKNSATYKIFEVPIARFKGAIYDIPYTKPEVKLSKRDNFVNISLLDSQQESYEEFEYIDINDFNLLESIKTSQDNEMSNMIYSTRNKEDYCFLEIYKTIEKPTSFLSFQGRLFKTIQVKNNFSFDDILATNIKYYYTFRFLNQHSVPSNASAVYEVEMKDEEGYKYLNVNKIDVNKKAEKSYNKNFKRYLLIRPSMIQTFLNIPRDIKNIDQASLGPTVQSAWDKDFIIRITSKKTNRVLEFDFKSIITRKKD